MEFVIGFVVGAVLVGGGVFVYIMSQIKPFG